MKTIFPLLLPLILFAAPAQAQGWQSLFDGVGLDGWTVVGDPQWTVKDGVIDVAGTGSEMGWLISERTFDNFVLRLRFKWEGGNSGIQFRSEMRDGKMFGYQANLDFSREFATGSLVEENGRGLLGESEYSIDELRVPGGWNTYEITAIGDEITVYVNGWPVMEAQDEGGLKDGFIALQMAPADGANLQFADIRVLELPEDAEWEPLFNGEDLEGWQELGDCEWDVLHDVMIGQSGSGQYGWLVSEDEYKDFHFSTRFFIPRGNSGIQFRSWVVGDMVHGLQGDIASDSDWISGHLYDQGERGIFVRTDRDFSKVINWLGWNTFEITAIGPKVQLFINGIKSIEVDDPERDKAGVFAFQIHSGMKMISQWDDIRVISFD